MYFTVIEDITEVFQSVCIILCFNKLNMRTSVSLGHRYVSLFSSFPILAIHTYEVISCCISLTNGVVHFFISLMVNRMCPILFLMVLQVFYGFIFFLLIHVFLDYLESNPLLIICSSTLSVVVIVFLDEEMINLCMCVRVCILLKKSSCIPKS